MTMPSLETTSSNTSTAATSLSSSPGRVVKKRRVERRERLLKTALCKHFDKPGGCPFPNCKFAHGRFVYPIAPNLKKSAFLSTHTCAFFIHRVEVNDKDSHSVAAQRKLIREQAIHRAEEQFQTGHEGAVTSKRRGTMVRLLATNGMNGSQKADCCCHDTGRLSATIRRCSRVTRWAN